MQCFIVSTGFRHVNLALKLHFVFCLKNKTFAWLGKKQGTNVVHTHHFRTTQFNMSGQVLQSPSRASNYFYPCYLFCLPYVRRLGHLLLRQTFINLAQLNSIFWLIQSWLAPIDVFIRESENLLSELCRGSTKARTAASAILFHGDSCSITTVLKALWWRLGRSPWKGVHISVSQGLLSTEDLFQLWPALETVYFDS